MSKAKRHAHKYYRALVAWGKVWACALPDCQHYMPQHMENLVNGKRAVCWECNDVFVLDPTSLSEDKPRCDECRTGISSEMDISEFLKHLESK